jgi:hypothetical protein
MLTQPTWADPVTAVLYVYGVFDGSSNWENFEEWIGYIQNSHFNIVVFSTFHVDSNGNLYGSVPLVSNGMFNPGGELNPQLPAFYQGLAEAGKTLIYSIGNSFGTSGDMESLKSILRDPFGAPYANLQRNMEVLASELAISGIDFDFEPGSYSGELQDVVTEYTNFCSDLNLGVTYCPYTAEQWWVDAQIEAKAGSVAWWNLQCYGGGTGNTPAGWLPAIQRNAEAMGVSDPAAFIVPGAPTSGPVATQELFSQWASGSPGLKYGFIWQFGNIESEDLMDAYGHAVLDGIGQAASVISSRA